MQIGFVNFNQEEKNKVFKVLQLLKDQRAIDELGIGRLRDAYSNAFFPGMSTLQGHAKYFVLLPSLYYQAQKKRYKNIQEVKDEIRRMEINLTQQLLNGTPADMRLGITGSDTVEAALKDIHKYVKYDPTYIYLNGLLTFGIIKTKSNLYACILEQSRAYNDRPQRLRRRPNDDEASDSEESSSMKEYFMTAGENYDFSNSSNQISLELTRKEASFLKSHIEKKEDSLLAYILRHDLPINVSENDNNDPFVSFEALGELWKELDVPSKYLKPYKMSLQFSRFVYLLRIVYELIYTERTGQTNYHEEVKNLWAEVSANDTYKVAALPSTIDSVIEYFSEDVSEPSIMKFCKNAAEALTVYFINPTEESLQNIMRIVENREKQVKGSKRSKLAHPEEYRDVRHGIGGHLAYRWGLVRIMIEEIRKGVNNGE